MSAHRRLAVAGLFAVTLTAASCTGDIPTRPEPEPEAPVAIELVSFDESRAVMRASEGDAEAVLMEFRFADQSVRELDGASSQKDELAPSQNIVVAAFLLGLAIYSAVETIRVCAVPLYQDYRYNRKISAKTTQSCIEEAASYVAGGVAGKVASKALKVTALRNSIKSMLGSVITHRQLQNVINKKTKPQIVDLISELTQLFYNGLVNGYKRVLQEQGVR